MWATGCSFDRRCGRRRRATVCRAARYESDRIAVPLRIMFVAWVAGVRPAWLAAVLSILAFDY